ncbi:carbohydrate kinase [Paenibacillus sp. FSL K6-1096]|uniref:carbohydrate kinase family protein n=1 Tax=Paenibacillus sp. FSL K6-1096 TaxID=2921460 RepID=UPI0030EEDE15
MNSYGTVLCVGELLIDFFCTEVEVSLTEGRQFTKQAGGAPANVSAAIARLGGRSALLGKVGADPFGRFLTQTLEQQQVDTSMLLADTSVPTTLAFVSRAADGERDFVFHRGADRLLRLEELDRPAIRKAALLHFGSATALLADPFREVYLTLMEEAEAQGQFISFDPNYREDLWNGRQEEFITLSRAAIRRSDLIKVSGEELELITGEEDCAAALDLLHDWGAGAVAVTLGKDGTLISSPGSRMRIPSIPVESVDSTGAGDAFSGALLWQISRLPAPASFIHSPELQQTFVRFANQVGAIVCTRIGAMAALPTLDEVQAFVPHSS